MFVNFVVIEVVLNIILLVMFKVNEFFEFDFFVVCIVLFKMEGGVMGGMCFVMCGSMEMFMCELVGKGYFWVFNGYVGMGKGLLFFV